MIAVENTVTDPAPVSTFAQRILHTQTSGTYNIPVPASLYGEPAKLTSIKLQVSSATPVAWAVKLHGPDGASRESRDFVTCGNSVALTLRNAKGIDPVVMTSAGPITSLASVISNGDGIITGTAYYTTLSPILSSTS